LKPDVSEFFAMIVCSQHFDERATRVDPVPDDVISPPMNNSRTHSAIQPDVTNPVWGNVSSDRLGYDGVGRMITKRFLTGGIDGDSGAYNDTTALLGFTTAFDRASNKYYERALHAESRSDLYQPFNPDGSLQSGYDSADRLLQYQRGILATTGGYLRQGGGSVTTPITLPNTDVNRAYNLDGLGNWKTTTFSLEGGSPATEVRQHNAVNQIIKFGTTPVLYDHGNNTGPNAARGSGNIVNDGTRAYQFDALNRLILVSKMPGTPLPIGAYVYDAFGRRIRKTISNGGLSSDVPNGVIDYLYDGAQSIEERNGSDNSLMRQLVWGRYIDEAVQLMTYVTTGGGSLAAGTYYPLQDLLYRTTALIDTTPAIVEAYDTDAYGNTLIFSAPGSGPNWWGDDAAQSDLPACEIIFCGYRYDPETQIYHVRARPYEPVLGRFVSADPADYIDGPSRYQYVRSSPINAVDPMGLDGYWDAFLAIFGEADPSVQNAFDEVIWDRTNGTLDDFTGGRADIASLGIGPRGKDGKSWTFNASDRASAACFANCWKKKTADALLMGLLGELDGSTFNDRLADLSVLPLSPFSAASEFTDHLDPNAPSLGSMLAGGLSPALGALMDPNGADFPATGLGATGRLLRAYGGHLGSANMLGAEGAKSFQLFTGEGAAAWKAGSRGSLRSLWKEAGMPGGKGAYREWQAARLERLENLAKNRELFEKAGSVAAGASLGWELYKCYRDCGCP